MPVSPSPSPAPVTSSPPATTPTGKLEAVGFNATIEMDYAPMRDSADLAAAFKADVEAAVALHFGEDVAADIVRLISVVDGPVEGSVTLTFTATLPADLSYSEGLKLLYRLKNVSPQDLAAMFTNDVVQKWGVVRVLCVVVLDGVDSDKSCTGMIPKAPAAPAEVASGTDGKSGKKFTWWPIVVGVLAGVLACCCCVVLAVMAYKRRPVQALVLVETEWKQLEDNVSLRGRFAEEARMSLCDTMHNNLSSSMVMVKGVYPADQKKYPGAVVVHFKLQRPKNVVKDQPFTMVFGDKFVAPHLAHVVLQQQFVNKWHTPESTVTVQLATPGKGGFADAKKTAVVAEDVAPASPTVVVAAAAPAVASSAPAAPVVEVFAVGIRTSAALGSGAADATEEEDHVPHDPTAYDDSAVPKPTPPRVPTVLSRVGNMFMDSTPAFMSSFDFINQTARHPIIRSASPAVHAGSIMDRRVDLIQERQAPKPSMSTDPKAEAPLDAAQVKLAVAGTDATRSPALLRTRMTRTTDEHEATSGAADDK